MEVVGGTSGFECVQGVDVVSHGVEAVVYISDVVVQLELAGVSVAGGGWPG